MTRFREPEEDKRERWESLRWNVIFIVVVCGGGMIVGLVLMALGI